MKRFRAYRPGMSFCLAGVLSVFVFTASATASTCTQWVAKAVSVQGSVQAQRAGEEQPLPAKLNDTFCPGDKIRVEEGGRAVLLLSNETFLRLDQNTTIRFYEPERERNFLLDLLDGAAYFISRTPKGFKCTTPYMNAGVEGTEFLLAVGNGKTSLSVFEGTVLAENSFGALRLAGGQSAVAEEGKPPIVRIVARPRDAVQWTLYYPPIFPTGPPEPPPGILGEWQSRVTRLLAVGRVDEAGGEIGEVLKKAPGDSTALALQSVIAVAQNDEEKAQALGRKAVETDPGSASARIALSYAQQAGFDLAGARTSVEEAVRLEPGNALAWARLSELRMSFGNLDEAL
ncbi:MAG TPA: FecR domain-containing protein, partial [Patescibacteria group bacterium]|nr:FecR domain-containing protein [Patescibacteria group bacterium]